MRFIVYQLILGLFVLCPLIADELGGATAPLDRMAVQDNGRRKPYHTFAIETLQTIYGKAEYKDESGKKVPAITVITDMWFSPNEWANKPIILVDYLPLRKELGMDKENKYASYEQLAAQANLRQMFQDIQAMKKKDKDFKASPLQREVGQVANRMSLFSLFLNDDAVKPFPLSQKGSDHWLSVSGAIQNASDNPSFLPSINAIQALSMAYKSGNAPNTKMAAEKTVDALVVIGSLRYPSPGLLSLELIYQKWHPFMYAWMLNVVAFVLLLLTTSYKRDTGYKVVWGIILIAFALQIFGLTARSIIAGRAPVTNMYETVIWLSFGCTLFALILEGVYKARYFLLAALPVSIISLILADSQTTILSSSIHPLVPVLRNNFWLTVHVLTITSSYAAFALALGFGHIILGSIIFYKNEKIPPVVYMYLYRTLQIGVMLLAAGTILGGVWANYSWGRFWDWDPKETWALITLLAYLIILHGRIAGWWGGFGLAVGSMFAFQSVLMAWYGVNFVLGKGLHSYGFGAGGFIYAIGFVVFEVVFTVYGIWVYNQGRNAALKPTSTPSV